MAVTYGFELKGKLDEAQLKEGWKLVQKELPYARTVIRIVVGEIAFVEGRPGASPSTGSTLGNRLAAKQLLHRGLLRRRHTLPLTIARRELCSVVITVEI